MVDLVEAGFIKKSFGAEGAMKIAIDPIFTSDFPNCKYIFIDIEGSRVPFFVTKRNLDKYIISLEFVDSPEEANKLSNNKVFLERCMLSTSNIHKEISDEDLLIDFNLIDITNDNEIGRILRVEKFPQQMMLIVDYSGDEIMIPLAVDWIANIDQENKTIEMNLPEGIY